LRPESTLISTSDLQNSPHLSERERPVRARLLQTAAGRIVSCAIVYAPFAFGSTQPWAIDQVERLLAAAFCLFLSYLLINRRWPRLAWVPTVAGFVVLGAGWFMAYNAKSVWDPYLHASLNVGKHIPLLPGAAERLTAHLAMRKFDALFGCFLLCYDMAAERRWRREWVIVTALTGAALCVFGVVQQAGFETFVPTRMFQMEGVYFATYNYHGNAGAFINLAEACSCGICFYVLAARKPLWKRACPLLLLVLILLGQFVNSSRGAQIISVLMLLTAALISVAAAGTNRKSWFSRRRVLLPAICGLLAVLLMPAFVLSHGNAEKWKELPQHIARSSSRWQVWRVTAPMVKSAGFMGHGPGAYKLLLPRSKDLNHDFYSRWVIQTYEPGKAISMWSNAHNDLLQSTVEHGYVGLVCGLLLMGGGLAFGTWRCARLMQSRNYQDGGLLMGCLLGISATIIHGTFDFPLQILSIQLPFAVLLAICWSSTRWRVSGLAAPAAVDAPR
jgi:O-Antigen ligase